MKDVKIEYVIESLNEHKQLLKMLGYDLDIINDETAIINEIPIIRDDRIVGSLTLKNKNLYWLKENKEILANENINSISFHQVPKYNKKVMFHTIIVDGKFKCYCYNMMNRNYISIENQKIKIKKFKDYIKIEIKEENKKLLVYYPDRRDKDEKRTEKINNIFGFDVISNIESYYSKNKNKIKK